jgi:hypothetical protein
MSKTHWKKLTNPNYIGTYSLPSDGSDLIVEIEQIVNQEVKNRDGKAEDCVVAILKNSKPMIVNNTNLKSIEKVLGTPFVEEWKGLRIALYSQRVRAFGQTVDAIRVRNKAPKAATLPELTPSHDSWETGKKAIQSGDYTVEQYRTKFIISTQNEKALCQK